MAYLVATIKEAIKATLSLLTVIALGIFGDGLRGDRLAFLVFAKVE